MQKQKIWILIIHNTLHIIILILVSQLDYSVAFYSWFIGLVAKIMDVVKYFLSTCSWLIYFIFHLVTSFISFDFVVPL